MLYEHRADSKWRGSNTTTHRLPDASFEVWSV